MERLDQLFRVLRTGGLFSGEDIQRKLGISQPVMSRLIRTAGSECVNIFETNFPDLYRRRSLRRLIKTWSMPGLFFYARVA